MSLPTLAEVELTADDFFGPELAMLFHNKAIEIIEEVTGAGTVEVVQ